MASSFRFILTGSRGYLGSRVRRYLEKQGAICVDLDAPGGARWRFGDALPDFCQGANLLIHAAYDFRPVHRGDIWRANVEGSRRLLEEARRLDVARLIHISSMSAFEGCASLYGEAKLETERLFQEAGGFILRPGLIWGEGFGGMVGKLAALTKRFSVLPVFSGGNQILYFSHHDDIAEVCARSAHGEYDAFRSIPLIAAAPQPFRFRRILELMASSNGRNVKFVSIPWQIVWLGLRGFEICGLPLGLRSDSLVSLLHQDPAPNFKTAERAGLSFRPFQ